VETTGKPFWLELGPERIFGILHTPSSSEQTSPSTDRAKVAVLILPTFGWDNDCSYRARRDWATRLAESGVMAARIDFPGTENSAGSPLDPDRVGSWVDATSAAADLLRQRSGCERLIAIGIGLGGLMAYQAVAAGAAIDDLVLWGVRASGRAFVREQRAYAAVVAGEIGGDAVERTDGAIGIGGHRMSTETAEALSSINLTATELPDARVRRVLLVGRDAHGVDSKLQSHLEESGTDLTVIDADDYHCLMAPPELRMVPTKTIDSMIAWMRDPSAADLEPIAHRPASRAPDTTETVEFEYDGVGIREHAAEFETSRGRVVGIICEPTGSARAPHCLVTVNSGALRHTGPNRMFVEIARRAAASGVPAARFDIPGLGDSDGEAIKSFERTAQDDASSVALLSEIYDHLQQRGVADRFVAGGLSIGGYLTVRAALAEERLIAVIATNPTAFTWTIKQRERVIRELSAFAGPDAIAPEEERAELPAPFKKIVDRVGEAHRSLDAEARRRLARYESLWQLEHRKGIAECARTVDELGRTGRRVFLMLSQNETLLRMLDLPKVNAKLHRSPSIELERLPTADHLVRQLSAQDVVFEGFSRALGELGPTIAEGQPDQAQHSPSVNPLEEM
jgi:dienelactone hydrolase